MNSTCVDIRKAILAMPMARTLRLQFDHVGPGEVRLRMPALHAFCFRPGQLQATAIYAIADFAAVGAAGTLLPSGWINATIDGTLKLLTPAIGSCLRAEGRVIAAQRLLTVCAADVYAVDGDKETLCATLLATARNIEPKAPR